jgi:hypothetical protein
MRLPTNNWCKDELNIVFMWKYKKNHPSNFNYVKIKKTEEKEILGETL